MATVDASRTRGPLVVEVRCTVREINARVPDSLMNKQKSKQQSKSAPPARPPPKVKEAPLALRGRYTRREPRRREIGGGITEVAHEEILFPLLSASSANGYRVSTTSMNPSNPMIRWLSAVSAVYDQYRFTRLAAHYIPTVPATTEGNVILAFDLDAADEPPEAVVDQMMLSGATMGSIWAGADCNAVRNTAQNWYYTNRLESVGRATEQCRLYAAVDGVTALDRSQGYIVLSYVVQFKTAELIHRDIAARSTYQCACERSGVSNSSELLVSPVVSEQPLDTSLNASMPIFTARDTGRTLANDGKLSAVDVFPGEWLVTAGTTFAAGINEGVYDIGYQVIDGLKQLAALPGDFTLTKYGAPHGVASATTGKIDSLEQTYHLVAKTALRLRPFLRQIASGIAQAYVGGTAGIRINRFLDGAVLDTPVESPVRGVIREPALSTSSAPSKQSPASQLPLLPFKVASSKEDQSYLVL